MDALIITTDKELLREGSLADTRIQEYIPLGKHIMVFVMIHGTPNASVRRIGSTLWIVPIYGRSLLFAAYKALRAARHELYFQRKFQVDLIDAHDAYLSAFVGWRIAKTFHRPLHIRHEQRASSSTSGLVGPVIGFLYGVMANFLLSKADSVSTDSDTIRSRLVHERNDWESRLFSIPRRIDIAAVKAKGGASAFDLRTRYPQYKIILLTVCPLSTDYNPALAIHTLAGVVMTYKFAGLVMVGEGPEKSNLQALAKKLGVADHVAFEPAAEDLTAYYKSAHIFLSTAPLEAYGTTIAEAAAASCAIVSTNVGLAASLIKNGESGYLCEPNDTACFVKTTQMLINQPAKRDSIRLNSMLAVETLMTKPADPAISTDTQKSAWEAAKLHFDASQKKKISAPKAARREGKQPSK